MARRRIVIQLPGGLGNQLFAYFAGVYFAEAVDAELILDLSSIDNSHVQGDFDIRSFKHVERVHRVLPASQMRKYANRIIGRLHSSGLFIGSKTRNLMNLYEDERFLTKSEIRNVYRNRKNKFFNHLSLRGYFQDFGFFNGLVEFSPPLELRQPSKWLLTMREEFEREQVLAMHLRLGDLAVGRNFELLGVLSKEYYKNALEIISARKNFSKIYVFSDNPKLALDILSEVDSRVEIVIPPEPADPAESLVLMSSANGLILGNSTFSYWAGVLSNSKHICYPSLFTRTNLYTPKSLPHFWIPVESSWQEKK